MLIGTRYTEEFEFGDTIISSDKGHEIDLGVITVVKDKEVMPAEPDVGIDCAYAEVARDYYIVDGVSLTRKEFKEHIINKIMQYVDKLGEE